MDEMTTFFGNHGTGGSCIRTNTTAALSWLVELRQKPGPKQHNEPVDWINAMLEVSPRDRPSALELLNWIRECESAAAFCGSCCLDEADSSGSSYQGSEVGDSSHLEQALDNGNEKTIMPRGQQILRDEQPKAVVTSHADVSRSSDLRKISHPRQPQPPTKPAEEKVAIETLLGSDFRVEATEFDHYELLLWTVMSENEKVARFLKSKGVVDELQKDSRWPVLFSMILNGKPSIAEEILSADVLVDLRAKGDRKRSLSQREMASKEMDELPSPPIPTRANMLWLDISGKTPLVVGIDYVRPLFPAAQVALTV